MRFVIVCAFMLFSTTLLAQGGSGDFKILTLKECIEVAWGENLDIQQASLGLTSSEWQLKQTKANVLPNLNGFASHNYNWGQRIDPFTNQFANTRVQSNSFGLSTNVTLFNGFQNLENIKAQEAGMKSSEYDLETQKNNIALAVAGAYLNILLADELIEAAEQQVKISENQLERTKKFVAAGSQNLGAQYDLEAQLGRDKANLTQRMNEFALAKLQLKQFLLIPAEQRIELAKPKDLESDLGAVLESSEAVYGFALSAMPEIKSAEFSLERAQHSIKSAQSGWYPSLSLSGSIGTGYSGLRSEVASVTQTGTEVIGVTANGVDVLIPTFETSLDKVGFGTQLSDNFNQFVGLTLSVPLFNRFGVQNGVEQAKLNQESAQLQLEQQKQNLRQTIESARADAIAARELLTASSVSLESASKAFEFAEARFEAGALNTIDFNNSKNNLLIAQSGLLRAKYEFVFRLKVLDFYMGKPISME